MVLFPERWCGQNTKARALAREASACGIKTKLADLDLEQATSAEWHRRRLSAGLVWVASGWGF
ncbi:hypothetical protein ACLB1R_01545 [Escherichia coli]